MATFVSLLWSPLLHMVKTLSNFYNKLFSERTTQSLTNESIDMEDKPRDGIPGDNFGDDSGPGDNSRDGSGSGDNSGSGNEKSEKSTSGSHSGGSSGSEDSSGPADNSGDNPGTRDNSGSENQKSTSGSGDNSDPVGDNSGSGFASSDARDSNKRPGPDSGSENKKSEKKSTSGSGSGDNSDPVGDNSGSGFASSDARDSNKRPGPDSGSENKKSEKKSTSGSGSEDSSASGGGAAWESGFWMSAGTDGSDVRGVGLGPDLKPGPNNDILDSGPGRTLILMPDATETEAGHLLFVELRSGFRIIVNKFKEKLPPSLLDKSPREKELHALQVAILKNKDFLEDRKFRLCLTSVPLFLYLLNANPDQLKFLEPFNFALAFANKK